MQQFWGNPKIAYLIFVLEMRTFNIRFEKHLILIFTNIQHLIFHLINFHRALLPGAGQVLARCWPDAGLTSGN